MKKDKRIQKLIEKRKGFLARIAALDDMVNGSIVKMYRRCYKPGCICEKGKKHGPAWALLYKEMGRTKMVYLPAGSLTECRRRLKQYGRFKEAVGQMIELNRQILKLELQEKKKGKEQIQEGKET